MLALLSACSTLHAAPGAARAVVPPRAVSPLMASWTAADMRSKPLKLPEEMKLPPGTATVTALLSSATDAMWKATVAATGKDQLRLNEDVELRPSFGKGMGVFAMRDIPVETVVARYSGQLYSMPEFEAALFEDTTSGDYAFGLPLAGIPGWVIDGENPEISSWSRYVNHSLRRQNCHAFPGPGFIYLEAVQDIAEGDELFFDYGDQYWVDRAPPTSLRRVAIDLL